MKIHTCFILCFLILLGSGCNIFQKIDVGRQTVMMKSAARTGTYFGLLEGVEEIEERHKIASLLRDDISENILSLLNGDNVKISSENRELLLSKIPMELRLYLDDALEILNMYLKEADISGQMDDNAVRLIRAFFIGVVEGCDAIMNFSETGDKHGLGNFSFTCLEKCS